MPSPVAHGLFALVVFRVFGRPIERRRGLWLAACGTLGLAPDLDFVPGVLLGSPARFHQGATHSLAVAVVVGGGLALLLRRGEPLGAVLWLGIAAYAAHPLLDLFGRDARPPLGVPLLWPLSDATYAAWPVFPGIVHAPAADTPTAGWISALLSVANLRAAAIEAALVTPLALLAWGVTRVGRRAR